MIGMISQLCTTCPWPFVGKGTGNRRDWRGVRGDSKPLIGSLSSISGREEGCHLSLLRFPSEQNPGGDWGDERRQEIWP